MRATRDCTRWFSTRGGKARIATRRAGPTQASLGRLRGRRCASDAIPPPLPREWRASCSRGTRDRSSRRDTRIGRACGHARWRARRVARHGRNATTRPLSSSRRPPPPSMHRSCPGATRSRSVERGLPGRSSPRLAGSRRRDIRRHGCGCWAWRATGDPAHASISTTHVGRSRQTGHWERDLRCRRHPIREPTPGSRRASTSTRSVKAAIASARGRGARAIDVPRARRYKRDKAPRLEQLRTTSARAQYAHD
jgi:hypothetical protein